MLRFSYFAALVVVTSVALSSDAPELSSPLPSAGSSTSTTPTTTLSTTVSSMTTNVSAPTPVTLDPGHKVQYIMELHNSGPAVLDSTIHFYARLFPISVKKLDPWPVKFIYQWMNMADMSVHKTQGRLASELSMTFSSSDPSIKSGEFLITVAAFFKDNPTKMAAFQTMKFVLTERLNGGLLLEQYVDYRRFPNVFKTGAPVTLIAEVHDDFTVSQQPSYLFFWYEGPQFVNSSNLPIFTTTIGLATNFTMEAVILATFDYTPTTNEQKKRSTKPLQVITEGKLDLMKQPYVKNGHFKEAIFFKDPLWDCDVLRVDTEPGDRSIEHGNSALINVTCMGSTPSSVCLNLSAFNGTVPLNETCLPVEFNDTLQHQVKVVLNESGWSDVHFFIYNDVSRIHVVKSYYGYDPDSVNVPALILPTVFGVIGVIIVLLGAAYIMRLRKKPHVEVADFDFHPSLTSTTQSEPNIRISRLTNSLKYMFSRNRPQVPLKQREPTAQAPLKDDASTEVKNFYDSL